MHLGFHFSFSLNLGQLLHGPCYVHMTSSSVDTDLKWGQKRTCSTPSQLVYSILIGDEGGIDVEEEESRGLLWTVWQRSLEKSKYELLSKKTKRVPWCCCQLANLLHSTTKLTSFCPQHSLYRRDHSLYIQSGGRKWKYEAKRKYRIRSVFCFNRKELIETTWAT